MISRNQIFKRRFQKMKNQKRVKTDLAKLSKDIQLPNEEVRKIVMENYSQKLMSEADNLDVDINHLENIFSNETNYLAMKLVPLLERKVLYLSYIENTRLNDICRRLKLQKKEVITLRNKAITHFKNNLTTLNKIMLIKKGGQS